MSNTQQKSVKISLTIEVPLDGSSPAVNVASSPAVNFAEAGPFASDEFNEINVPTGSLTQPARVNSGNKICVRGQAADNFGHPPVVVYAKIYTVASLPSPLPSTPPSPNVSTTNINASGFYQFDAVPLPLSSGSTNYVVVTWAQMGVYPYPYVAADVIFAAAAPGPYTDCNYPRGLSPAMRSSSNAISAADMELVPVAWKLKLTGFSGGTVQLFNGERKLNLVQSAGQGIVYCNGGDGTTTPQLQLRCSKPGITDWELSFALGQKRVTYRQCSTALEGKLFQNPVAVGFSEEDGMPAMVSIHPA